MLPVGSVPDACGISKRVLADLKSTDPKRKSEIQMLWSGTMNLRG